MNGNENERSKIEKKKKLLVDGEKENQKKKNKQIDYIELSSQRIIFSSFTHGTIRVSPKTQINGTR